MKLIMIAVGGAIGALLRYGLSVFALKITGEGFPYGTLTVNIIGSFFLGLFAALVDHERLSGNPAPWVAIIQPLVMIGLLGALTTFSTFGIETFHMFRRHDFFSLFLNIILNLSLSLLVAALGWRLAGGAWRHWA